MEYIYHDPSAAAQGYHVKGNSNHPDYPDDPRGPIIETDLNDATINILENLHNGSNYFSFAKYLSHPGINTDLYPLGNYRDRSSLEINADEAKYALLNDNSQVNYIDFDSNITGTDALNAQITDALNVAPKKSMVYDTVKLHLVNSYDISNEYGGFILELNMLDSIDVKHYLSSLLYLNSDSFEKINPRPFILGGAMFNKYIEFKVPSLKWMEEDWNNDPTQTDTFVYAFTNGNGPKENGNIDVSLRFISNIYEDSGYTYFNAPESMGFNLNREDEYAGLIAVLEEAEDGEYFKLYGEYDGEIYENFITSLMNTSNADYIVFHDIQVFEQIGLLGEGSTSSFIETSNITFVQTSDFEDPYLFRPIIKNANAAVSYRIEYNLRLYNSIDNSQIIKRASFGSFDTKKYGKKMKRINLGTVPTVTKIYNVIDKLATMEIK